MAGNKTVWIRYNSMSQEKYFFNGTMQLLLSFATGGLTRNDSQNNTRQLLWLAV